MTYLYLGDMFTDPRLMDRHCDPVLNGRGKCIRGRNANMLVRFADGSTVVVLGRRLRRLDKLKGNFVMNQNPSGE